MTVRRKKPNPLEDQRRRCVLAVAMKLMGEGQPIDKAVDRAFAICTRQLQRHGYLEPGTATPTVKGMVRSMHKAVTSDAGDKTLEYQALLEGARQMRAIRRGPPVDVDRIITSVIGPSAEGAVDVTAILESMIKRGAANVLPLPGSRNADLCRELTQLREAMDEVFTCDTVFGDCRVDEGYPSAGHCMLAAMVVQDLFGGSIQFGTVKRVPHYWNRIEDRDVDLTGDQFDEAPVRAKRTRLNGGGSTFDRKPGDSLLLPANAELMSIHERFVRKLIPVLRKRGYPTWADALSTQQKQRKKAA